MEPQQTAVISNASETRDEDLEGAAASVDSAQTLSVQRWARLRELAPTLIAGASFAAFVAYFSLLCVRPDWGGDFQMYCSGISRLYHDFRHPLHEALALPSEQSTVYTVYLVALALLNTCSPIRAPSRGARRS
jgi:hypothetical protein